jgi:hypothetical protein
MDDRTQPEEDPYQEPANSTVDDWHGQKLAPRQEEADRLMAEADGDTDEAQARFEEHDGEPH